MTTPRVSVVVPNYNHARFLDERLSSLLDQTFTDLEIIVVDDGSTDESAAVIARYAGQSRLRAVLCRENSGTVFRRWNDGAALATGEYLLFANADDSCLPTQVERLVARLDAHPGAAVAACQSWEIDAAGRKLRIKHPAPRLAADFVISGDEEARYALTAPAVQNASSAIVRRRVYEACGGFDLTLGIAADWMFWCRTMAHGGLAWVAEPLNCYRKHDRTVRAATPPGSDLPGQYRVHAFVLGAFPFSDLEREAAWDRLAAYWAKHLVAKRWRVDVRHHARVWAEARRVDPRAGRRVIRALGGRAAAAAVRRGMAGPWLVA